MRRSAVVLASLLVASGVARAEDLRVGYQISLGETAGSSITNNEDLFAPTSTSAAGSRTARLQGVNFTTSLNGNLTFDLLTSNFDHAAVIGAGFSQTVPTAVPDDATGTVRDRVSTFQAGAQYLARIQRETWGLAFGASYSFLSNGRLVAPSDASTPQPMGATTTPGQQFSTFLVNGEIHTITLRSQAQISRRDWDLGLLATYAYTRNGVFNLAPGSPGQGTQGQPSPLGPLTPRLTTNLGTFVRQSTHAITPSLTFRTRLGARGVITSSALLTYTRPNDREPQICDVRPPMGDEMGPQFECLLRGTAIAMSRTSTGSIVVPPFPETINSLASIDYTYLATPTRAIGFGGSAIYGMRIPTEPRIDRMFMTTSGLSADSLILQLRATFTDTIPWDIRLGAEVGVAQPYLFQPPLGPIPANYEFQEIHGDITPTFNVSLSRTFTPVNATLQVTRSISPGALGASAIVNQGAALTFSYQPQIFGRTAQVLVGFNANESQGIGRDLFRGLPAIDCDPSQPQSNVPPGVELLQVAFNNRGLGANVGIGFPLFREGDFAGLFGASYTATWLDPDPDGTLRRRDGGCGRPSFFTHAGLLSITLLFGHGPLQELGPGSEEGAELSAFSQNPATGSPVTSAKLLKQGAPMLDLNMGRRPGEPAPEAPEDKQAYEHSRRQQEIEQDAKKRADTVRGSGTIQDEEERAQEKENQEQQEREKKRSRKFTEWPMDLKSTGTSSTSTTP